MPKNLTLEQINKESLFRQAEVRSVDKENRTVSLAFSSEQPYMRWFGEEVLDHGAGAVKLDRLKNGAALLINHDVDDQVGVVESVSIDADKRGRAVVRFGKGARASEIWQDVQDGIRKLVSVGYAVNKVEIEERKGMADLVRVTDWEPYEISLVSVPADPTVGIGRSKEQTPEDTKNIDAIVEVNNRNKQKTDEVNSMPETAEKPKETTEQKPVIDVTEHRSLGTNEERERVNTILSMARSYKAPDDMADKFIKEGKSVNDFQRSLLEHMNSRGSRSKQIKDEENPDIGMSDKEVRQFSFVKALRALANPNDRRAQQDAAFEYEASSSAATRMGKTPQGILVPSDVLSRSLNTATSGSSAGDTGGFSIATSLMAQSFIDMLRNRATIMQLGTTMSGLVGNIAIPKQASGATGYWLGEDDQVTGSTAELAQIGLTPKTVGALSEITRKLLQQSSLDVEAMVRSDIAKALALTIDSAGYYGTGSNNQPKGITKYSDINTVDFGTDGVGEGTGQMPTFDEIVAMESAIAADNADVNSMAYVFNSGMRGHFKTTQKFDDTNGATIWEPGNTINGYRTEITNQVASGDIIFGNFSDLLIGLWGGLDLTVDPYTHSDRGRLRIVAMQDVDYVLRRGESFCYGSDITAPGEG
jgi:HK97 family phage major capsid protein/HK97 family phage prohead protease